MISGSEIENYCVACNFPFLLAEASYVEFGRGLKTTKGGPFSSLVKVDILKYKNETLSTKLQWNRLHQLSCNCHDLAPCNNASSKCNLVNMGVRYQWSTNFRA